MWNSSICGHSAVSGTQMAIASVLLTFLVARLVKAS